MVLLGGDALGKDGQRRGVEVRLLEWGVGMNYDGVE